MRLLNEDDVVKTIDKHTLNDGRLDNDITCILEEIPTANIRLVKWLEEKIADAQREWDVYVVEEALSQRDAYMNVLSYLRMKGVIK